MQHNCNQKPKLYSEKLLKYLESYSDRCSDITFIVGPDKQEIKSSRIIIEVGCPRIMELFDEKWGQGITLQDSEGQGQRDNGILLPNVDPEAFQLFIKLLISDADIFEYVKSLNVTISTILDTIELCKVYGMMELKQNLQLFAQKNYLILFADFVESDDFIKLSKSNLDTILSMDDLNADEIFVFNAVCKWSAAQCAKTGVENTGQNIRRILGDTLFKIRFPVMEMADFCANIPVRDILTNKEQVEIYRHIGLPEKERKIRYSSRLPFSITARTGSPVNYFNIVEFTPNNYGRSYACTGAQCSNHFKVKQKVEIFSFGFMGPVDSDGDYNITLEILNSGKSFGRTEKRISAKKNVPFDVCFDQPISLIATYSSNPRSSGDWYDVRFTMKGPNTCCPNVYGTKELETEKNGVGLYFKWRESPMLTVRLKKC